MEYAKIQGYPEYNPSSGYGLFGYPSAMVHQAVRNDDKPALQKMLDEGWITKDRKTIFNHSMREYCLAYGGVKCAELFD